MEGKVALVTGGGTGIGRGIAEAFAELGAQVAVIEIDAERAASVRTTLSSLGSSGPVHVGDASEDDDVVGWVNEIGERYGRVDVVVNNVGSTLARRNLFVDTTTYDWDALYRVNLHHIFLTTRAALPLLRASGPGGSIISLSSIEAFRGIPERVAYGAFKAAVTGFTMSLALELGPEGIRVNAIAPETTETEAVRVGEWLKPDHSDDAGHWIPLGRFGRPRDAAGCAVFLATELSSWVTGTTIHLDGGALAASGWVQTPDSTWTNAPVITGAGFTPPRNPPQSNAL
jgi:3-oxoacyl-[acyl-carrier protein] reductase